MSDHFDVIIVGGGLVGASLAAALAPAGLSVALVEPDAPRAPPADDSIDARVYAISPGAAGFLEQCGAWQRLPEARVARIETMQVHGDDPAARLDFTAYDAGLRELAFIVENRVLQHVLWEQLRDSPHVQIHSPARCTSAAFDGVAAQVALESGRKLSAQLVIGADGGDSWVRRQARIEAIPRAYGQLGVVANFRTAKPHRGTAFQWFRRDGVLALLPLPGNRVSMVWSTPEAHGRELLAAAADALAAEVAAASRQALGELELIAPAAAFPLQLQRVAQLVRPRVALVGDAAHNVHPLAGQGVNLGFRDARELATVLARRGAHSDCGDYALLRRYERARKEDILAMQLATDGLQQLFAADAVWLERVRNLGLKLVDAQPLVKTLLVRQAAA